MTTKDRALLQDVGAAMRSVDSYVFVNRALTSLGNSKKQCISDVRSLNEYETLKEKGFVLFRIECSLPERIKRIEKRDGIVCDDAYVDRLENAPVETYLLNHPVDFTINNEGSIEDTRKQVEEILRILEES